LGGGTLEDKRRSIPVQETLPYLFSFAKNEDASSHTAIYSADLSEFFHLPLSDEALDELYGLQTIVTGLEAQHTPDPWEVFGSTTSFKVSKAYGA
jgi:hypothetical protein